jgi:hypothetical protein
LKRDLHWLRGEKIRMPEKNASAAARKGRHAK